MVVCGWGEWFAYPSIDPINELSLKLPLLQTDCMARAQLTDKAPEFQSKMATQKGFIFSFGSYPKATLLLDQSSLFIAQKSLLISNNNLIICED